MEDIGKEAAGHRVSVSMPSLDDANDDFPATNTESVTDSVFSSAEFASTSTAVSAVSEIALDSLTEATTSEESPFLNSEILTGDALKDDLNVKDAAEVENVSQQLIDSSDSAADDLIAAAAGNTSESIIDAPTEGLDESQGDEDPSIAIDQFIKKIADEQLSSKRIEERQEEEAQEQEEPTASVANLDENMLTSEDPPVISIAEQDPTQEDKPEEATEEKTEQPEPMDIDDSEADAQQKALEKVVAEAVGDNDDDDEHMAESIEEIQKEINKIPPKKLTAKKEPKNGKEEVNNGIDEMEEDIEEILGGTPDEDNVGKLLKIALEKEQKLPTASDSVDVAKNPTIIESAKEEISKLDILICGECHNAFYFNQELMEHKKGKCPKVSRLITSNCDGDNRQQVWGYCLWKSKYVSKNEKQPSNWSIYQSWCNLPQVDRNAWISAGVSIQFASKFANSKVMEMRPTKTAKQSSVQKITSPLPALPPLEFIDSNKENSSTFSIDSTGNIVKKGFTPTRQIKLNDVRITPTSKVVPATSNDTNASNDTPKMIGPARLGPKKEEFVVEKIMAKRFNPRRKTWEYNIKWENFGHDSNTWEPMTNLSHCKKMLDQFEEQLKRMKEEKAKSATASPKIRGRPTKDTKLNTSFSSPKITNVVGGVSEDYGSPGSNRPQRHSKQKAMNRVKDWCGDQTDSDDGGVKRKYDMDDDSDDDFEDKRIKLEPETEDSDEAPPKPKLQAKKVSTPRPIAPAKTVKNGNTNMAQQIIPSNILIPDANGVVRINQKQLPSLKSGVYIMSKTAGIIKLDSNTSKMATSGGQTVVKVLPKVGQSHIKVVSKDGKKEVIGQSSGATPVRIAQATTVKAVTPKLTPKLRKDIKKVATPNIPARITMKKVEETPPKKPADDEDSDDGLEPLPFPAPDEPIPALEEEEKNDDFVLDPETGKIAGMEYVDKPVVIKNEPQAEPATTTELENIVKIAAADLSDDEFDGGNDSDDSMLKIKEETPIKTVTSKPETYERAVDTSTPGIRKIVKYTISGPNSQTSSGGSKNIVQVQSKPRQISRPQPQPVRSNQQQKVLNQMVTQQRPNQQIKTVVRHVIQPARPGENVTRKPVPPLQLNRPRNSLPSKLMPSPLQPTRTYSAMGGIRQTPNASNRGVQVYGNKGAAASSPALRRVGNSIVRASSSSPVRQQAPQQQQQIVTQKPQVTRIVQRVVSPQKKTPAQQIPALNASANQIQNKPVPVPVKSKTIINMPSLMEEDTPLSPPPKTKPALQRTPSTSQVKPPPLLTQPKPLAVPKPVPVTPKPLAVPQPKPVVPKPAPAPPAPVQQKAPPAPAPPVKQEPALKVEEPTPDETSQPETLDAATDQTNWASFTMTDGENPIFVTGDDGTIYQVAGQNEDGQTILITQGPDGQQQCLLVTNEIGEMTGEEEPQPSTSTANLAAETPEPEIAVEAAAVTVGQSLQTPLEIKTDQSDAAMGLDDQIVAQVVQAEPVSPGGTHKVVVMLPDGNLMVTQVSPEEYAKLELEA